MEEPKANVKSENFNSNEDLTSVLRISPNWKITGGNERLGDAVSIIDDSKVTGRLTVEDIVCTASLVLRPANANVDNRQDACTIYINSNPGSRISRIGIVSEASVLEFFKDSGEYAGTVFAECMEEYDDATVYLAEFFFDKPTTEASIKFTRIHNSRSDVYLYGIKLVKKDANALTNDRSSVFEDILRSSIGNNKQMPAELSNLTNIPDYDGNFMTDIQACLRGFVGKTWSPRADAIDKPEPTRTAVVETIENAKDSMETEKKSSIECFVDEKLRDMEERLLRRIDDAETKINDKLDAILKSLELRNNTR